VTRLEHIQSELTLAEARAGDYERKFQEASQKVLEMQTTIKCIKADFSEERSVHERELNQLRQQLGQAAGRGASC